MRLRENNHLIEQVHEINQNNNNVEQRLRIELVRQRQGQNDDINENKIGDDVIVD